MSLATRRGPDLAVADKVAIGLGVTLVVLLASTSGEESGHGPPRDLDLLALAIFLLAVIPLPFGRRWPGSVSVAVLVISSWWYAAGFTSGLINLAPLVAFFLLGLSGDRRRQVAVGGFAVAFLGINIVLFAGEAWTSVVDAVGWTVAAILAGEIVCQRRLLLDEYAARASRAESERDAEADKRVAEERLRIARDLHDVLAHTVAIMTVQAGVAADAVETRPSEARAALDTLRAAGRDASSEVQAMVSVLRHGEGPPATAPAPRLDLLPELVTTVRLAGLEVVLAIDVGGSPLAGVVELTAFRVVQEGLTNVVRHTRAQRAWVSLHRERSRLVVTVRDDGKDPGDGDRGHGGNDGRDTRLGGVAGSGLAGMRERVESLGGDLTCGPTDLGWVVTASLPIADGTSRP